MDSQKPVQFNASALDYFILFILSIVLVYIPFFGWAYLLNYSGGWFADHALVTGKKIQYKAGYGESLKFIFINTLLLIVTLGIYTFWFYPKLYRYVADHVSFVGETVEETASAPVEPVTPVPTEPTAPAEVEPVQTTVEPQSAPVEPTATPEVAATPEVTEPAPVQPSATPEVVVSPDSSEKPQA